MKKCIAILGVLCVFICMCIGCKSGDDDDKTISSSYKKTSSSSQKQSSSVINNSNQGNLGDYNVIIDSFRLAKDEDNKDVIIIKYNFKNNSSESDSFLWAVSDKVFQNNTQLENAYFIKSSYNYSTTNQSKEIRNGASLYVEIAYELINTTSNVEVEVSALFSLSNNKVTKTFNIQ